MIQVKDNGSIIYLYANGVETLLDPEEAERVISLLSSHLQDMEMREKESKWHEEKEKQED